MKQFFKIVFACLTAMVLAGMLFFLMFIGALIGSAGKAEKNEVSKNSVLVLDMTDVMKEQGSEDPFAVLNGGDEVVTGLNDVLRSIKAAKTDDRIKGIYLRTGVSVNGWATLQEIRAALKDFKSGGKFIVCYGEISDQKSYYLASVSDEVYLNPHGGMEFNGLSITGMFFKGAIDKLDIKTEAFHCGKYKGAYEPYALEKYSDPNRYQLSVLLGDLYGEFLQAVAEKTGKDTASLARIAAEGVVKFPKDALAGGMIDGMLYADSVEALLRGKLGLKEKDKISMVSPSEYASALEDKEDSKNKIAVLYAEGAIYDGSGDDEIYSKDISRLIRKIAKDEDIKAVVLRVNSPGGSALASEVIYHELQQLRKKKPIVVSMGNYAASGGYYIACAADSIIADPNTLTGSIGVVGVMFNIGDMMKNKLGVTTDVVKTGPYADFPNMTRPMTELERNWIQGYLDTTYTLFKSRVAQARRMSMEQVEELAQGHVYSGKLAKELKLVDELGPISRAMESAASLAKLKDYSVEEFPKPRDKFTEIISTLSGKKREDAAVRRLLGEDYAVYAELQKIRSQKNSIQALMPWFEIR
jgi:protease-4